MTAKKLTLNGMTVPHTLLVISALGMIGTSIYLMAHFFQTFYPIGLAEGQICQSAGFFSCDAAAYSPVSAIMGIPNALFGILAGCFLLFSSIFPSAKLEATNNTLARANALGCIVLFLYSIVVLGHLCPGCTIYYIFSLFAAYLFYRHSDKLGFNFKIVLSYAVITALSIGTLFYSFSLREQQQQEYKQHVINQYNGFGDFGDPTQESQYRLASSTEKFSDAPLRISIFSDFQCPYCSVLAKSMQRTILRYSGKINIQFFYYPLDSSCNGNMTSQMHPFACKASYLTACLPQNFPEIHDMMFEKGADIDNQWLDQIANEYKVTDCMNSDEAKKIVINSISAAGQFEIRSTPTMIINGKKVEGALSSTHLAMILDHLISLSEKK